MYFSDCSCFLLYSINMYARQIRKFELCMNFSVCLQYVTMKCTDNLTTALNHSVIYKEQMKLLC